MGRGVGGRPGDEEILARAHNDGRVVVTLDKDFGELAIVHGLPHSGILRLVNLPAKEQGLVAVRVLIVLKKGKM
jgi:predicted nuclease of predicted toxin-antitoxin system